jgi:hypothetical protein
MARARRGIYWGLLKIGFNRQGGVSDWGRTESDAKIEGNHTDTIKEEMKIQEEVTKKKKYATQVKQGDSDTVVMTPTGSILNKSGLVLL